MRICNERPGVSWLIKNGLYGAFKDARADGTHVDVLLDTGATTIFLRDRVASNLKDTPEIWPYEDLLETGDGIGKEVKRRITTNLKEG